jgi:hypothetical protein
MTLALDATVGKQILRGQCDCLGVAAFRWYEFEQLDLN